MRIAKRLGEALQLVAPPHTQVRRIFELLGFAARLRVCDTLEDALARASEKPCLV